MNCVGIDVSKGKSMIAVMRPFGEVVVSPFEVRHTANELSELAGLLKSLDGETRVVMESTGNYHAPVAWLLHDAGVPFPVSWTVKMKKKQKETQDILSYHTQAAGCSDKARAKASGGRQPIEECGRTGL